MAPSPYGGIHPDINVLLTWPPANYNDPVTRQGALPTTIIFTILTLLIVGARLFVRGVMQRNMGLDDWLLMIAMVPTLALAVGVCLASDRFWFNRHVWDIEITDFVQQRKMVYANELFYLVATGLIKISILLFYRRLKDASISRRYLWIIYASIAFVAAYSIQCIILLIFNCTPISDYWNQLAPDRIFTDRHPNCVGEGSSLIANTAISLSQDFVAAVVPTYLFWTLTLDRKNKLLLAVVFVVAYATCAIGCIRLYYIYYVFYRTYDVPWHTYDIWICTILEVLLGACCASAPPLKVFVRRLRHFRRGTSWFKYDPWGYNGYREDDYTYGSRYGDGSTVSRSDVEHADIEEPSSRRTRFALKTGIFKRKDQIVESSDMKQDTVQGIGEPTEEPAVMQFEHRKDGSPSSRQTEVDTTDVSEDDEINYTSSWLRMSYPVPAQHGPERSTLES